MADQTSQDKYVKVGEVNTRYWVQGSQGLTVILIHGIGAAVDSWAFNINALAQKHRVYAIDLVGFGRSDKPSVEYSLPFFAQFVKDFMETQNIDRPSLVGWSLGGGVSLQFAIQFPERLDKLILLDSMGFGRETHLMFRLSSIPWIGKMLSRPSKKGTARLLKECVFDHTLITDEIVDLYYQFAALPGGHEAWLATLCSNASFSGIKKEVIQAFRHNLGAISKPTLIIWGKQDRVLPVKHASIAESWITNARVHLIDDCGHCPQMEHPEEFNTQVLEFLNI
jgi:4,5:9,10-diseco-3-hydroxy-5,9,17-trioxoandrosta-1(10),2-diene-4-oate hydrolase